MAERIRPSSDDSARDGGSGEAAHDAIAAALLELVPEGALLCHGDYVWINRHGAELAGLGQARALRYAIRPGEGAMPLRFTAGGRELPLEQHPVRRARAQGAEIRDQHLGLLRADGTEIAVVVSARPLRAGNGAIRGAVITFAQASQAESGTDVAMGRVERLASLGALAASIAHEVNNPLNSIMVNAELALIALNRDGAREKARQALETIVRDVKRCGSITRGVLQLSKREDASREPHDLNQVVRQAHELVAAYFRMRHAALELELEDLPLVPLDPTIMEHAVINLLRNAAEAGGKGSTVRVRTRHAQDTVFLNVSDDGPGIAPEHLDKVFQPLFSTRSDRDGTGLGLSLVQRTVRNHGGTIRVESEPGTGTAFTIELPVAAREDRS